MAAADIVAENRESFTVRTKPCWICGQHSEIEVPHLAWIKHDVQDIHIDVAWPEGTAEQKQLIRTGIHPKCWDEEFPSDTPKDTE